MTRFDILTLIGRTATFLLCIIVNRYESVTLLKEKEDCLPVERKETDCREADVHVSYTDCSVGTHRLQGLCMNLLISYTYHRNIEELNFQGMKER